MFHRATSILMTALVSFGLIGSVGCNDAGQASGSPKRLLNVSYDPTREFVSRFQRRVPQALAQKQAKR